ncbi:MAG: hypothetical protein M3Q69_03185 [Acidobacteriota bacterium]|nr:hypothetical protein [Acidobacteriota bacterium]
MEDGRFRLSSSTTFLARALSVAGHPFLLVPLTVALSTRSVFWTSVIAASTTLPMLAIIARKVRRGAWSDFDVSRREQRPALYYAAAPLLLACAGLLYWFGAAPRLMRSLAAGMIMFAVGLLANRFLKVSMHAMFAAFCGVTLVHDFPRALVAVVAIALAIAWSRLHLERHTMMEVLVGALVGGAAGVWAFVQ